MSCDAFYWLGVFITFVGMACLVCPGIYLLGRLHGTDTALSRDRSSVV